MKNNVTLLVILLVVSLFALLGVREFFPTLIDDLGDFFTMFSFIALVILVVFGRSVKQ